MRIDQTTAGGKSRNDEDYDFPTGIYLCQLKDVVELPPKEGDESKTPRLVFEFEVADGEYRGKKVSTFVRKNLFAGTKGKGNASHLYKLARSLGVLDPMAGFDTTQFIGKHYTVVVKNENRDAGQPNGRAWPDSIMAASPPANAGGGAANGGAAGASAPAPAGPAPRRPAPTPTAERKFWVEVDGEKDPLLLTADEIRKEVCETGRVKITAEVNQDGTNGWVSIAQAIPESKDWIPF